MRGCHRSKIVVRDGEYYCGPYRVWPDGQYVAPLMVQHDSLTQEQRKNGHLESDASARIETQKALKRAGL